MLRSEHLLADRERALVERLRLGIVALNFVQQSEVVEAGGDVRMLRSEQLLAHCEGALVERLRLGIAALNLVQSGEIVEVDRNAGMLRSEYLLIDRKRASGSASA
jgi:hypothetical protein